MTDVRTRFPFSNYIEMWYDKRRNTISYLLHTIMIIRDKLRYGAKEWVECIESYIRNSKRSLTKAGSRHGDATDHR